MEDGVSESELLTRARRGDASAVRVLYERYAPRVYAVVRRMAGDDTVAEDWAQDTWVQALRGLADFRGDAKFGTWVHRIAINCALHGLRQRERQANREAALLDGATAPARGKATLLRIELERALDQIPDGMRTVLILHDVEGYTHEEIGSMLGVSPGTSKSQLFKARGKMRRLLQPVPANTEGAS